MIRHLSTWLLLALAGGGLLAGCGESGSSTSTITAAATSPAAAASTSSSSASAGAGAAGAHGSSREPASQTASPAPTTATTSTGTWNSAQCEDALTEWYKGHPHASKQQVRGYKITLATQHACFSAHSLTPVVT